MKKLNISTEVLNSFSKLFNDFIHDLTGTFPELIVIIKNNKDLNNLYFNEKENKSNETVNESIKILIEYCCSIYPSRFFDILYKNNDIFQNDEMNCNINCYFVPDIDFKKLWPLIDEMNDTKEAIWKYLQLVLFLCSQCIEGADSFGDTAKMFEAINENDLLEKLTSTIENMTDMFDISENFDFSMNDISVNIPDANDLHSHLKTLLEGNLGKLAHEIAEETAEELQRDMSDSKTVGDVFQRLMKNPSKLLNMIKKVGSKLDEKIKSGEIKESELMKEASEMMEKMKNMPGMGGMDKILSQMGMTGGKNKINFNAIQSHMKSNIRQASQRERMLKKLEENRKRRQMTTQQNNNNTNQTIDNTNYLQTTFGDGEIQKSKRKKKKKKKKKNKNKKKN
jgi:hypothetical protein